MPTEKPLPNSPAIPSPDSESQGRTLDDFYAYMPTHQYIPAQGGPMWVRASVNSQIPPLLGADGQAIAATDWLDRYRPIDALVWAPGQPQVIRGRILLESGWEVGNSASFNLYRPPAIAPGDSDPPFFIVTNDPEVPATF